jgi:hypothetical protein
MSSFKIYNKLYNYVQSPGSNVSLVSTDSNGQLVQKYIIDDDLPKAPNVLWTSEKVNDEVAQLVVPTRVNDVASIDETGQYQDSGYIIDDSLPPGPTVLWTSSKVGSCATKANLAIPSAAGNLAKIDITGQYQDSSLKVDDSAAPSTSVLYTSSKSDSLLATKADLTIPAAAGNLAKINISGQYQDSSLKVDDSAAPSTSVLYTSSKSDSLLATKADLTVPAAAGNLAGIDISGQYQDSALKVDDSAAPSTSVLYTSSKSDSLLATKADLTVPAAAGNLAGIDILGQYQDSSLHVDDSAAPSTSVLYTSSKSDSLLATKADLTVPAAAGNLAGIDILGQYQDSTLSVNDALPPSIDVLYTSHKTDSLLAAKADLNVPASAGSLARIDITGQYEDSNVFVNDSSSPSSSVLYTSSRLTQVRYYGIIQYTWTGTSTFVGLDHKWIFSPSFLPDMVKTSVFHIDSAPVSLTEVSASNLVRISSFPHVDKHNFSKITISLRVTSSGIDNNLTYFTFDLWRPDLTTLVERTSILKTANENSYRSKNGVLHTFVFGNSDAFITSGLAFRLYATDPVDVTGFTLRFYFE